jgi:hypothetical protein
MKVPKAFGIWMLEEQKLNTEEALEEEPAEIDNKPVYCPICKKRMKMWMEGCTLLHIICENCNLCLTMKTENGEIFEKLVGIIYE